MPTAGDTLGPYQIVELLGTGGMGEVWKARDTRLGRSVAIKVGAGNFSERFDREARAVAALNHPNICTLHDVGPNYLVMELVEGAQLTGPLPVAKALEYALQIAAALEAAHAKGIVHRDLKPANILVTPSGIKLLDFGLAKTSIPLLSADGTTITMNATAEGQIVGTIAYMSPEQADAKSDVDARSDLFSFGAVFYEMLTGRTPFEAESPMSMLGAILHKEPRPVRDLAQVPRDLARIVERCLRKDRALRWQSAADLKAALLDIKRELDSGVTEAGEIRPVLRRERRWTYVVAGIAIPIVLAVVALWRFGLLGGLPSAGMKSTPMTSFPGEERFPAFSPDGSSYAFAWNGESQEQFDIYVSVIGAGSPLRLTTHPADDVAPSYSPDGKWIAFLRRMDRELDLMLMPAFGGSERKLASVRGRGRRPNSEAISWTPDGKWIAVPNGRMLGPDDREAPGILLFPVEGGEPRRMTTAAFQDFTPAFNRDGTEALFVRSSTFAVGSVMRGALDGSFTLRGEPERIAEWARDPDSVNWTSQQNAFYVIAKGPEGAGLYVKPLNVDPPPRLLADGTLQHLAASTDGRLMFSKIEQDMNLYSLPMVAPGRSGGAPEVVFGSTQIESGMVVSPSGERLAFLSDRSGERQIWVGDLKTGAASQASQVQATLLQLLGWSPDGKTLAFVSNANGTQGAYVVSADGGAPRLIVESATSDGGWLDEETLLVRLDGETPGLYAVSLDGKTKRLLAKSEPGPPASSYFSGGLAYIRRGQQLLELDAGSGSQKPIATLPSDVARFVVSKTGIYFTKFLERRRGNNLELYYQRLGDSTPVKLAEGVASWVAVSPDEKLLYFSRMDRDSVDIVMLEPVKR